MNISRKSVFFRFVLLLALLSPMLVQATCYQSNMTGTWFGFGVSGNARSGDFDESDRCKIKVNSSGNIVGSKSSCTYRDGSGKHAVNVTGGILKVESNCKVTGRFRACANGFCGYTNIEYGMMARDKITFSAVAYSESNPDNVGDIHAIKR